MNAWRTSWGTAWASSWGSDQPLEQPVDGSGLRTRRRRVRPLDSYRTPEDIRREQLETERYLATLEKPQQVPAPAMGGKTGEEAGDQAPEITTPAAHQTLADVRARAASAAQAKIEEAASAAALDQLAKQERRQVLALLLALD